MPVLLEPGAVHPLLADTQWLRADNGDHLLERLVDTLEEQAKDPRVALGWDSSASPYPGLHVFDESRAGVFYGRDEETDAVLARLMWPHAEGSERLVLVVGPSGTGKSSLLRGGVIPRLRRQETPWVIAPTFMPHDVPFKQLAAAVADAFAMINHARSAADCEERLRSGGLAALVRELHSAAGGTEGRGGVLLTIDQAEQLVTEGPYERLEFVNALAAALASRAPLRVAATLRDEFLARLTAGTELDGHATSTIALGPLPEQRLADVIQEPARRAGIDFEEGLVQRMVSDTTRGAPSGGDPLPLLAFTLEQVFEKRSDRNRITTDDYQRVGGVTGALQREADEAYERLKQRGRQAQVVSALLELVQSAADEREPAARTARRSSFDDAEWDVVQEFVKARLVTVEGADPVVTVAHEALLRDWRVIRQEIESDRDRLVARSRLERDAREWQTRGRRREDLLTGRQLRSAFMAGAALDAGAGTPVGDFLTASRWEVRRARGRIAAIALAAVVAVIGAWFGVDWLRERAHKRDARSALFAVPVGGAIAKVDSHEVTYGQYRLCLSEGRCQRPPAASFRPDFDREPGAAALTYIEQGDAADFCGWIGRRLPTLAELRQARALPRLKHLLDTLTPPGDPKKTLIGGREWTSTDNGHGSYFTVWRAPRTHEIEVATRDPSRPEFDTGFRCAAR